VSGPDPAPEIGAGPRSDLPEKDRHGAVRRIEIDLIDIPPTWRKNKKAAITRLADSLEREGLRHPIGVRLNPQSGRFTLVFGGHRVNAAKTLGWKDIDATVLPEGMCDAFYPSATDAENLFRTNLS